MSGLSPEMWSVVFGGLSTLAVVIAVILAVPQLVHISRAGRLQSSLAFIQKIRDGRAARAIAFSMFPGEGTMTDSQFEEVREQMEEAINALNEIGALLEQKTVDKRAFFGYCHSMVIRTWYVVRPFAEYRERCLGGRYGRRVAQLDRRARLFHDVMPQHRATSLRISWRSKQMTVYRTTVKPGGAGVLQRVGWGIRRVLKLY